MGDLLSKILYRQLIQSIIDEIPAGALRNPTERLVRKTVQSAVTAAVTSAWTSASETCKQGKGAIEEKVTELLQPVFEQEVSLKEEIAKITGNKINPFLEDVGTRLCQPVLRACAKPITKAFIAAINGFAAYMKNDINSSGYTTKDVSAATIRRNHMAVGYWYSGPLEEANRLCWDLYASDVKALSHLFSDGYSAYSLYADTLDAIQDLTHRGIHAYFELINEFENEDRLVQFNSIMVRFVHDAKIALKSILISILSNILQTPMEQMVITPCLTLVTPVQDAIDSIPVPGLSSLFNVITLTEEVLQRILDDSIDTLVSASYADVEGDLDKAGAEYAAAAKA